MRTLTSLLRIIELRKFISMVVLGTLMLSVIISSSAMAEAQSPLEVGSGILDRQYYEEKIQNKSPNPADTKPGQMYPYSDVDPRRDDSQSQAEAKKLSRGARKNLKKKSFNVVQNTKRVLDKQPESLEQVRQDAARAGKQLSRKAERNLSEFGDRAAYDAENLKENAKAAADAIPKIVGDTAERAKSKVTVDKSAYFRDRAENS
jgi:hypothetical protein